MTEIASCLAVSARDVTRAPITSRCLPMLFLADIGVKWSRR
jgi:hypothetical protein